MEIQYKKEEIKLFAWLKNNESWYYPDKKYFLDLNNFENFEILNFHHYNNFLVYAWNDKKEEGKLFKASI